MNRSRFRKPVVIGATAVAGVAAVLGLAACPTTTTTTLFNPVTGLTIDSADLVAGLGCGTAPNQVYKYAAVVTLPASAGSFPGLPASGVFDCYDDGQFSNLPTPDGGTTTFNVAIYAYNQQGFPASALGGCINLPSDAACQGENPSTVDMYASHAQWKTTCTAEQFQGVSSVAVCAPLVPTTDASLGDDGSSGEDGASGDGSTEGGSPEGGTPGDAGDGGAANDGATGDGATGSPDGATNGDGSASADGATGGDAGAGDAGSD